jgi:hypothetical protein
VLREDRQYRNQQFWDDFLTWEHTACRRTTRHEDYQPWEAHEVAELPPSNEEDEENEDYHVVRKEAAVAMEDATPPLGAGDLPPEYQAVIAGGYDEKALLRQVLEASKADEDAHYEGYSDAIAVTGMVARRMASLPPPPSLPPHARPVADYVGQEVPPPPGVSCRRHCQDHPQGVVINPPPKPQQEVVINLVSNDDE